MSTIFDIFRKANAVIESCNTEYHLEGARMYLTNFIKLHTPGIPNLTLEQIKENIDSLKDESPEDVASFMVWELYDKLIQKEKQLKTVI